MRVLDLFNDVASALGDRSAITDKFLNALNSATQQVANDMEIVNCTIENTTTPDCAHYELPDNVIEPVSVYYNGELLERQNYSIAPRPTTSGTPRGWCLTYQGNSPCVFLIPPPNDTKNLLIQARVLPKPVFAMDGKIGLPFFTRQALVLWTILTIKQALNLPGWENQLLLYQREIQNINSKFGGIPRNEGGVKIRKVYIEEE